jgi:cysteine desulfurase/selenocysteine lyase
MKDLLSKKFSEIRKDFPMLKQKVHGQPFIYLDSAATTHKPQVVIDCIYNFYKNQYATVHRAIYDFSIKASELFQNARLNIQNFIGAQHPEEIIFTRGTTESINMVAYSFGKGFIKPKDEIIISEIEHHSNIVPWQMVCEDRGAVLRIMPVNDKGEILLDEYRKLLNPKTKLVSIAHVSNSLGTLHPIKEIIKMAHGVGAKVLIDGAQSAPHLPINVQDLDCDFFVFSGHKVYGPTGIGVLYGKKELLNTMPPYQGGGDMIDIVTFDKTTYNSLPFKFEAGTPIIAEAIALGEAIRYVEEIGMKDISDYETRLTKYTYDKLLEVPNVTILGTSSSRGSVVSFNVKDMHPLDIGTLLDLNGVAVRTGSMCTQTALKRFNTASVVRVSLGLYNNKKDVDIFLKSLQDIIKRLS